MRDFNIAENEIMSRTEILAVGLEEYIIERMCSVAADDRFVRVDVDFRVGKAITAVSVLAVCAGFADVFRDNNGAGFMIGTGCLQFIECGHFNRFAERAAEIARFFLSVHVLAVAAEALQTDRIQQPFLHREQAEEASIVFRRVQPVFYME